MDTQTAYPLYIAQLEEYTGFNKFFEWKKSKQKKKKKNPIILNESIYMNSKPGKTNL